MSGGVRNLRAMFENKDESTVSPPDRGRSPAGSIGGGSNGTSPRPLSKVRTSFVAVERSGQSGTQWGLRKENSSNSNTDPSLATRRESFSTSDDSASKTMAEKREAIRSEYAERKNSAVVSETITESAIESPLVESEKTFTYMNGKAVRGKSGSAESKPGTNPDKKTSVEDRNAKLLPGDPKSRAAVSGGTALNNVSGFGQELHGNTDDEATSEKPSKSMAKSLPTVRSSKPTPISISYQMGFPKPGVKPTKSPSAARTPTKTTATGQTLTASAKSDKASIAKSSSTLHPPVPTKALEKKTSRASLASATSSKATARPTPISVVATTTTEKKASVASPPDAFHKPKPKSPTKPVKLPSSLTAPTSSSLSKVAAATAPSSRQSLGAQAKMAARSPSRTSSGSKQELRHKSSKLENTRPSLGPPPSASVRKQPSRQSLPKQVAPADENFLARMMRPTTASASKTHEKIVTPPRTKLSASRPTTRDGTGHHKLHEGMKGSPSTTKLPMMPSTATVEEIENAEGPQAEVSVVLPPEADKVGNPEVIMEEKDTARKAPTEDSEVDVVSLHHGDSGGALEASPSSVVNSEYQEAVVADAHNEKPIEEELQNVVQVPEHTNTESEVNNPLTFQPILAPGNEVQGPTEGKPEAGLLDKSKHTLVPGEKSVDTRENGVESGVQNETEAKVSVPEEIIPVNKAIVPNGTEHENEKDFMGVD